MREALKDIAMSAFVLALPICIVLGVVLAVWLENSAWLVLSALGFLLIMAG